MRESTVKNYEELPLFLSAKLVSEVLGVSPSSAYELMHEKDFPALRIGNRLVVPKDHFREWVDRKLGKCGAPWRSFSITPRGLRRIILRFRI